MSGCDLLHHKLSQRCDALVRAVLPQPVCHKILKNQRIFPQPQCDANEVPGVLNGTTDDFIPVL